MSRSHQPQEMASANRRSILKPTNVNLIQHYSKQNFISIIIRKTANSCSTQATLGEFPQGQTQLHVIITVFYASIYSYHSFTQASIARNSNLTFVLLTPECLYILIFYLHLQIGRL